MSTTIWSGGAAAGLYLGTGLILACLVHTHYDEAIADSHRLHLRDNDTARSRSGSAADAARTRRLGA